MLRFLTLLGVLAVCAGGLFAYRSYSRNRDLAETLHWMSQTYNPRQDDLGGHGRSQDPCAMDCGELPLGLFWKEVLSYQGCQMTTVTTNNRKEDKGLHETFNLRDIDLDSIKVSSGKRNHNVVEVEFAARDGAQALVYTGNIVGNGIRSRFTVDDAEYAERFAKAFTHAVELCGGRPSKF